MTINTQKVGDPRLHTVVQSNIKNPRKKAASAQKPAAKKPAAKAETGKGKNKEVVD